MVSGFPDDVESLSSYRCYADDGSTSSTPSRTSFDEDHSGNRPLLADAPTIIDNEKARDSNQPTGSSSHRPFNDDGHPDDHRDQDDGSDYRAAVSRSRDEQNLTIREAIKAYPMAIFWSLAVSMCVIMEGFDSILVPNFYAFPTFQRKCTSATFLWVHVRLTWIDGEFVGVTDQTKSGYQLSATWMAIVSISTAHVEQYFTGEFHPQC